MTIRAMGIAYGQNQDDGTGRSVRRNFNIAGWMVDSRGKVIDPDYVSPEELEKRVAEKIAKEQIKKIAAENPNAGLTWDPIGEPDLLLSR